MTTLALRAKRGDSQPTWTVDLTLDDGSPAILDEANDNAHFVMRGPWETVPRVDAAAVIADQSLFPGRVSYTPTVGDLDTAGEFRAEFRVTFSGGSVQTFPTTGAIPVLIEDDLAEADARRLYCTDADLVLGDLEIASRVKLEDYIRRATRDIDVILAKKYVTPVPATAPQQVQDMLNTVCADLASAYVIMAVAQGGEDGQVNAYGMHLFNRAMKVLTAYVEGDDLLEGVDIRADIGSTAAGPVAIRNEDPASLVKSFYEWAQPTVIVSPAALQQPAVRPYGL